MDKDFYMIRHGLSCSNIFYNKNISNFLFPIKYFIKDPFLSDIGCEQSRRSKSYISDKIQCDIVLSSSLIRAIETASCMFPNNKIEICPYICELNSSLENQPYTYKSQINRTKHINNKIKFPETEIGYNESDSKKFFRYVFNNYDCNKTIAIITHSSFLMKIMNLNQRMLNNAIYKVTINSESYEIVNVVTVFSGYKVPENIGIQDIFRKNKYIN